jgi:hypothetical protein
VINHSLEYTIAALASWVEFWIELVLFPGLKRSKFTLVLGLLLAVAGQVCRVAAMHTAKSHFNHIIMEKREDGHQLVTWGIYGCGIRETFVLICGCGLSHVLTPFRVLILAGSDVCMPSMWVGQVSAASVVCGVVLVGGGHAGAALQPRVYAGLRLCELEVLRPADTVSRPMSHPSCFRRHLVDSCTNPIF